MLGRLTYKLGRNISQYFKDVNVKRGVYSYDISGDKGLPKKS
jgi:hypothetical protein